MEFDCLAELSAEKDCWLHVTDILTSLVEFILTLKMTSTQDVETSLTTNSHSQDSFYQDIEFLPSL